MDGGRFDDLTRSVAGGLSRRRMLRSVAGGSVAGLVALVRGGRAAGQEASLPLGGACAATAQCRQDQMGTAVCADNGIAADGALTCCHVSGCCGSDADCCGDLLCAPTGDVCSVCLRPPFATKFVGDPCADSSECVASVIGSVICADNGVAEDGVLNCCFERGGLCYDGPDSLCCGSAQCIDGVCGGGEFFRTLPPGSECTGSAQCSQGGGETVCADNGIATDGALNCCRYAGGACASGAGCCGALACLAGVCQ
ncbi:MAG: hypothetical protein M3Q10_10910 [Chloroflexota bacterium]|nr:hypothetical protein [Chloroflexota bacterium]